MIYHMAKDITKYNIPTFRKWNLWQTFPVNFIYFGRNCVRSRQ